MASIQKTRNGWKARVRRRGLDLSNTFALKSHASAWAARKEREISEDSARGFAESRLRRITFEQIAHAYLEAYQGRDKERSTRASWWISRLGKQSVLDIDRAVIRGELEKYAAGYVHVRGKKTDRQRGPTSYNRQLACLSAIFQWAIQEMDLPENPCRQVKFRREEKRAIRFLRREEIDALLGACQRSTWPKLHLLVTMALTTGCRRSELMGLRWGDIDWNASSAHLKLTKNGRPVTLVLQPHVLAELSKFRQVGQGLVFCGKHPMRARAFDAEWREAIKRAGISPLRFHDLRHTCASLLAQQGASLLEIGDVLNHKSLSSTKIYAHLCVETRKQLLTRVLGDIGKGVRHA